MKYIRVESRRKNKELMFDDKIVLPNIADDDVEFLPLLSEDDEQEMNRQNVPEELSILPLRNTVLFPGVIIPITVGRDKSIRFPLNTNFQKVERFAIQQIQTLEPRSSHELLQYYLLGQKP